MKRNRFLSVLIPGALALTVLVGLAGVRPVYAASEAQASETAESHGRGPRGGGGISSEDLAAALGITTEELSAAQEEAKNAAIDQALEQGLITQAQADALRTGGSGMPFGGRGLNRWLSGQGIDFDALLAGALGISVEDLTAARSEAASLAIDRAVEEGRLTEEQADQLKGQQALYGSSAFQTAMRTAFEAAVNAAVQAGVITQAQADAILANSAGGLFGGPHGGMGGVGRGRHNFGGMMPADPSQAAPSTPDTSG